MIDANVPRLVNGRRCLYDAAKLLRRAAHRPSALQSLELLLGALDMLEVAERELVAGAREQGATWEQVGTVYGVTRQAARQRFGVGAE